MRLTIDGTRAALAVGACAAVAACGTPKSDEPPAQTQTQTQTQKQPLVAGPATADPAGPARATMVMVHGGGWAGHDERAQQLLMEVPGKLLLRRGWRVVSLDYEQGTAGLDDVLKTVRAEIARGTSSGPLCLYGESSGGHLALVAAARLGDEVDCVIGLGAPADLPLYLATAKSGSPEHRFVARLVREYFGTSDGELKEWDPLSLIGSIKADVLLMRAGDDTLVPATQSKSFDTARPATRTVTLQAGELAFVHGSISARGRARYEQAIASFAARARRRDGG
jgi:acetyl esterase/lipase